MLHLIGIAEIPAAVIDGEWHPGFLVAHVQRDDGVIEPVCADHQIELGTILCERGVIPEGE